MALVCFAVASVRHDLLRHARVRHFRPGEIISEQGDTHCEWLACASGAVRVTKSLDAAETALTFIQPGVWFADPGLFDGGPCTHTAVAFGATTILRVSRDAFLDLLAGSAELAAAVLRLQARHVRDLYDSLAEAALLPLRPRLARQIASLARRHGVIEPASSGGTRIGIPIPQQDLARLARSSRQRVNAELKQLERAGVLRVERAGLVVSDPEALDAACRRAGQRRMRRS